MLNIASLTGSPNIHGGSDSRFSGAAAVHRPAPPAKVAPAGGLRGLAETSDARDNAAAAVGVLEGRMTLATIQVLIVTLIVWYAWTRNVQGGG